MWMDGDGTAKQTATARRLAGFLFQPPPHSLRLPRLGSSSLASRRPARRRFFACVQCIHLLVPSLHFPDEPARQFLRRILPVFHGCLCTTQWPPEIRQSCASALRERRDPLHAPHLPFSWVVIPARELKLMLLSPVFGLLGWPHRLSVPSTLA
ncbi:hypothetical protein CIRG_09007 [Coccidioides immitis RMSCC 2394]|uniref:Uncharacterized protein n=1 Tax=Coccidioides immitis RMSCC 2394 TaxID=404692 RepID=A0A0J6YR82_COCIT|nr:hypothetical protein CIRG_09007 [Coccidioides immitis RMSCC 2394]